MKQTKRKTLMEREGITRGAWWLVRYVKHLHIQKGKYKEYEAWAAATEKNILSNEEKLAQYIAGLKPTNGGGQWDKAFSEIMCGGCNLTSCTSCNRQPLAEKICWWLKLPVDWDIDGGGNGCTEFQRIQKEPELLAEILEALDYDY